MNRRSAKKIVLGQLANLLSCEVIIDGVFGEDEIAVFEGAQNELIEEFTRRAGDEKMPEDFDRKSPLRR